MKARDFVFKKLKDYGFLSDLKTIYLGGELGSRSNEVLFDLITDTLILLNKYNIETKGNLEHYIRNENRRFFSINDLGGFVKNNLEDNYYRQTFPWQFASGLPISKQLCGQIISKLESIYWDYPTNELADLIKSFKNYEKLAPKEGKLSKHSPFFLLPETKLYQIFELMKVTKGLCPFTCEFFEGAQLTGDASPGLQCLGVLRGHLEGNPYFEQFFKYIGNKEESIWKTPFKFMLAPISAQPHYSKLHGHQDEELFNLIIQARMYHLYQLAFADREFSLDQLKSEFMTVKLSAYIHMERASLDPQEEIFLWAPLEEEVSQPQDKESYYGFEFDSQRFTQFIEDFKERLDKYNPLNLKQWFEETLEQPEFYEKYEDLAARMSEYSWVSGQAPKLSWSQFTDLSNEDAWAWLVKHCCIINENQEIRFMSIFDLLEPYSNLNLHSSYK